MHIHKASWGACCHHLMPPSLQVAIWLPWSRAPGREPLPTSYCMTEASMWGMCTTITYITIISRQLRSLSGVFRTAHVLYCIILAVVYTATAASRLTQLRRVATCDVE